jgi:hypothetical protein
MTQNELLLELYATSLKDIVDAIEPIPEAAMTQQPVGLVNHPAWMLSHIAHAAAFIASLLDEPCADVGPDDLPRYGPGSVPVADPSHYAPKAELLERLTRRHQVVENLVQARFQDYFDKNPPAPFDGFAPTIGRIVVYLLAAHESYHLGQLMDWKRATGMK